VRLNFGFPEDISKRFEKAIRDADREYARKIEAAERVGINALGYDSLSPWEREEQRVTTATKAALEYFGALLFVLVEAFSLLETSDKELLSRVNPALTVIRKVTLDHRWPRPEAWFDSPGASLEPDFDRALISWLEGRAEWRTYEARVAPHIEVPTVDHGSDHEDSNPLLYFPVWPLEQLSPAAKKRIMAGLLGIHGQFLDGKAKDDVECWRLAYDSIAKEVDGAELLSEDFLSARLPEMVADANAGGRWSSEQMGRPKPTGIFSVRFGSQFYPLWRQIHLLQALKGRITHWSGRLLVERRATTHEGLPSEEDSHTRAAYENPSRALRDHRLRILKAYIAEKNLDGMDGLARRANTTPATLYGMVRGDSTRYSPERLDRVLKQIGCSKAEWHGLPNPNSPA
jgi:hypothetical protein